MQTAHEEKHIRIGGFLKEAVFGFNDGLVSTFAVIAGLVGGQIEQKTILLAALATLIAGAFSMALGTYLGSKSERELYESERKRELYEMEHMPEIERQEIYDIYAAKGFKGKLLDEIVAHIIKDPKLWLDTMMREELGFGEVPPRPGLNGIIMGVAFIMGSMIPTVPYLWPSQAGMLFKATMLLSAIGLLLAGGFKTKFTKRNIFLSALETLLIGALAAGATYGVGVLLT